MGRIANEIKAWVKLDDGDAILTLREPLNQELNDFLAARYVTSGGKKMKDNSYAARFEFFDQLLIKVENLEDNEGKPITVERKELIPAHWKANIIIQHFEYNEIDIKN